VIVGIHELADDGVFGVCVCVSVCVCVCVDPTLIELIAADFLRNQ